MQLLRTDTIEAEQRLLQRLLDELKGGKNVLWLLSGGSNIHAAVRIMEAIPDEVSSHLTIALIDERYGPVGHPDSNWHQLQAAGLDMKQAASIPCLREGLSQQETAQAYEARLRVAFESSDCIIGLLGMGADGHIAGILPESVAAKPCQHLVIDYKGPDHQRITLTFKALDKITALYVFAFGASKLSALQQLYDQEIDIEKQPAQFLKRHQESYLYNDQLGETI